MKKIIFVCEGIALSHYVRSAVLAEMLDEKKYEYWIAASLEYKDYAWDKFIEIPSIDVKTFDLSTNRNKGKGLYNYDLLNEYVSAECRFMDQYKPDLVIGDMRFSLGISSKIKGIPYVSLINAYWSPYGATQKWLPDKYFVRFISDRKKEMLMNKVISIIDRNFSEGYNQLARENNLSTVNTMEQLYTNGDYCFYPDVPEVVHTYNIPQNHRYIGAITDFPECFVNEEIDIEKIQKKNKKIVYLSLGSTGDANKISRILDALSELDIEVIFVTTNKLKVEHAFSNFTIVQYANPKKIFKHVDLVICNGGSGTIYQAFECGKPVLGLPTNMDQFLACNVITEKNTGKVLRYKVGTKKEIKKTIMELLTSSTYKLSSRKLRNNIRDVDTCSVFNELVNGILKE